MLWVYGSVVAFLLVVCLIFGLVNLVVVFVSWDGFHASCDFKETLSIWYVTFCLYIRKFVCCSGLVSLKLSHVVLFG